MKKIKSFIKKTKNLDVAALAEGMTAKKSKKNEELAKYRSKICVECKLIEEEPIKELSVKDSISGISEMICGDCACALPLMVRQKKKSCPLGKW